MHSKPPDATKQPPSKEAVAIKSILERWELTLDDLTKIVDGNPSLRGMMLGYIAEYVLHKRHFTDARLSGVGKDDDHDRSKKGDLRFLYRGHNFRIECKSLQTNMVKDLGDGKFAGTFQCDASDRRPVDFSDGSRIETTCLLVGEFDIVAVNLFAFKNEWLFAFALNRDLPRSTHKKYTAFQQKSLLASSMKISIPLQAPYVSDPFQLLDILAEERKSQPMQAVISSDPSQKSGSTSDFFENGAVS